MHLSRKRRWSWSCLAAGLWARQIAEVSAAPLSTGPAQGLTLPDSLGGDQFTPTFITLPLVFPNDSSTHRRLGHPGGTPWRELDFVSHRQTCTSPCEPKGLAACVAGHRERGQGHPLANFAWVQTGLGKYFGEVC